MEHLLPIIESLKNGEINLSNADVRIYEQSFTQHEKVFLLMVKDQTAKWILVAGQGQLFDDLSGTIISVDGKVCPLTNQNRLVLNKYFDYTIPKAFGPNTITMGLGDRLGLASPGHIHVLRDKNVKPVLAQQSIRELTLTNRTMNDVLDDACFAVFQEGYRDGFGADGDHLKKEADIQSALAHGMSMLTLDCSDYIRLDIETASETEIEAEYEKLPNDVKDSYNEQYLNKTFALGNLTLQFDEQAIMKNVLIYREAINYMIHIYNTYINKDRKIDFEISIDETATVTSPQSHFFVANELYLVGVKVTSLAPRFCGEFQKGIDYIGDITQFEHDLKEHVLIAEHFGYKVSVHSGSDKFKVFPIISKITNGTYHIKTAGTNWLEAVRVIAKTNPILYRKMHVYALEHFEEALQYYHVTPNIDAIEKLENVPDEQLTSYMEEDNARQLFHVTYGILLAAKDENGKALFKEEFFATLNEKEDEYRGALTYHIGKHLEGLGL